LNYTNKNRDGYDGQGGIFVITKKHAVTQTVVVVGFVLIAMVVVATIGATATTNTSLAYAQRQGLLSIVLSTTTGSTTQDQIHVVAANDEQACGPKGLTYCASSNTNTCANLQTDKNNCGKCGNRCSGDQICQSGSCTCAAGQIPKHCPQIAANFLSCVPSGSCFKDGDVCQTIQAGCHSDSQCPAGFQCVL
jgi:hypothetical protein